MRASAINLQSSSVTLLIPKLWNHHPWQRETQRVRQRLQLRLLCKDIACKHWVQQWCKGWVTEWTNVTRTLALHAGPCSPLACGSGSKRTAHMQTKHDSVAESCVLVVNLRPSLAVPLCTVAKPLSPPCLECFNIHYSCWLSRPACLSSNWAMQQPHSIHKTSRQPNNISCTLLRCTLCLCFWRAFSQQTWCSLSSHNTKWTTSSVSVHVHLCSNSPSTTQPTNHTVAWTQPTSAGCSIYTSLMKVLHKTNQQSTIDDCVKVFA